MLVRNEDAQLAATIASVKSIVSEIVVVDLGSSDNSIQIAENLGALIYPHPWSESFAAPRNLAIEKAGGAWVLVLDAGESVAERDCSILQHLALDTDLCFEFPIRHYTQDLSKSFFRKCQGEYPERENGIKGYFETSEIRLFPRHEKLRYEGEMNELLEPSIRSLGKHKVVRSRVPLHSYRCVSVADRQRSNSSPPVGDDAGSGADWESLYREAKELKVSGKFPESLNAYYRAVEANPRHQQSWIEIGNLFCRLGRYEEAAASLETALKIDGSSHEARCELGMVALWRKDYPAAERWFREAMKLNCKYIDAYCHLATALAVMHRLPEAEEMLRAALYFLPQSARIKADLGTIYYSMGDRSRAEQYLLEAINGDSSLPKAYYQLGQIYRDSQRAAEAVQALSKFLELGERKQRISFSSDYQRTLERIKGERDLLHHRLLVK